MPYVVRELGWFESGEEKVLGMLVFDKSDDDYACYVLGRDAKNRFRTVDLECSIVTEAAATEQLKKLVAHAVTLPAEEFYQGDEVGEPIDFFSAVVPPERQSPSFKLLTSSAGYSPALGLLTEITNYFEDPDGNFVEQFQSSAFNARLWELYLYALFTEIGYGVKRDHAAPDFHLEGPFGQIFVEATTINPSALPPDAEELESLDYFQNYVPIKFGSALYSKLQEKYWELPHVAGHPLVFSIQDFQTVKAMTWSNSALVEYLYGIRQVEHRNQDGTIAIVSEAVTSYEWKGKRIAAGFFSQPDSENVSAVLANPSGTLSKFNRMGFLAGFGDRRIRMLRKGICYKDGSLFPQDFVSEVHAADYSETWCEGLSVYHNPNATQPLRADVFPCAAHHTSRDGRIVSRRPSFYPIGSITAIITSGPN